MHTIYIDDSGSVGDTKTLTACGWAAKAEQWKRFEPEWLEILGKFGLSYFHMRSFRQHKGEFAKFKNNLPLETDLLRRLQAALHIRAEKSFGCVVNLSDWDLVNQEYELTERMEHPFAFVGCVTISKVRNWMAERHPTEEIEYVFEAGTKGWGALVSCAQRDFGITARLGDPAKDIPLQAADFSAWELNRAYTQAIDADFAPRSVRFRGSMTEFVRQNVSGWITVGAEDLRQFCRDDLHNGDHALPTRHHETS